MKSWPEDKFFCFYCLGEYDPLFEVLDKNDTCPRCEAKCTTDARTKLTPERVMSFLDSISGFLREDIDNTEKKLKARKAKLKRVDRAITEYQFGD